MCVYKVSDATSFQSMLLCHPRSLIGGPEHVVRSIAGRCAWLAYRDVLKLDRRKGRPSVLSDQVNHDLLLAVLRLDGRHLVRRQILVKSRWSQSTVECSRLSDLGNNGHLKSYCKNRYKSRV